MEKIPIFNSVEDECRYWKERAKFYYKEWTDTKQEFDEYVEDSKQLEAEMEATAEQKENVIRDLRKQITFHENECESFRVKLESIALEFKNAEKQLMSAQVEKENMKKYLRQLEQQNDDLERGYRILSESIAGVKTDLDKAYEKNALLEIEVDEKEFLQEKLQRLMDETRDLKQELHVKDRLPCMNRNSLSDLIYTDDTVNVVEANSQGGAHTRSLKLYGIEDIPLCLKWIVPPDNTLNGNVLSASSRTTALNIVADMLRKLNAWRRSSNGSHRLEMK
ncbi:nuclear distribution protein nudE homolog isoform X2 [Hermetia illucens]|uniref:nuclear distribution protein nudE homolog isoform X2 n=1 Tax=Hermetia illucens TaxID=343691 RepID=UPI0018CC63FC|nr:nuclear distribution protein nudE homolog isoform X2 [Hermetia illucens]